MWHQNVGYFVVWFVNSATEKIQNILPHFFRVASGNLGRYMRFDCQSFVTLSRAANNKLLADLRVKQTVMPRQLVKTALWGHQCLILVTASWCALNSTIASICIFASLQIMFVISWNLRSKWTRCKQLRCTTKTEVWCSYICDPAKQTQITLTIFKAQLRHQNEQQQSDNVESLPSSSQEKRKIQIYAAARLKNATLLCLNILFMALAGKNRTYPH